MVETVWYPSVEDVLDIHDEIVSEYADTEPGVRNQADIEFALTYISEGPVGADPQSIHEKAFHLIRLLVANHPFVDGNKRTALNTASVFYLLNGYRFTYDTEIREILKRFGTDEATVDDDAALEYLGAHTEEIDLDDVIAEWRQDLIQHGIEHLTDESPDPND